MSSSVVVERSPAPANTPLLHRHRSLARPPRPGLLADRIAMHIESLVPWGRADCLDVGAGDLTLADSIEERLLRTNWHCIDVCSPARPADEDRFSQWGRFDGRAMPYGDGKFDVALLCDTLQRAPEHAATLLVEAGRVARYVLVKDRFRSGGDDQHFTQEAFGRLVSEQGLIITALDCGLERYDEAPVVGSMRRDWPFIAVLRRG